jgi:hypothetical protein
MRATNQTSAWHSLPRRLAAAAVAGLLACAAQAANRPAPPVVDGEAPRVQALLEQGWAAESGRGLNRNPFLAAGLYRQAGAMGSAEGYYRAALVLMPAAGSPGASARCLLMAASQLGHGAAGEVLERRGGQSLASSSATCDDDSAGGRIYLEFDLDGYVKSLRLPRQDVVRMIRRLAPIYGINPRLAVAMAAVESNFDPWALSPKSAMGVMQLIPATAERFGVRDPFNPEQNIRGGLAYLRWLDRYYRGDTVRMVAAYNAGEGAVDAHGGVPPYRETQAYVQRVLSFSGGTRPLDPTNKKTQGATGSPAR